MRAGESFALDVVIASERPTRGVQFGVQFDPALLQIDDILEGDFYRGWAKRYGASTLLVPFTPDNGAGQVAVGAIALMGGPPALGPTGRGVLATVKLTAKVGASGRSGLGLTGLVVADTRAERVPVQVTAGEIVVGSAR